MLVNSPLNHGKHVKHGNPAQYMYTAAAEAGGEAVSRDHITWFCLHVCLEQETFTIYLVGFPGPANSLRECTPQILSPVVQ